MFYLLQLFVGIVVVAVVVCVCVCVCVLLFLLCHLNAFLPACTGLLKLPRDECNFITFLLTLEASIVTHIQFLPTITLRDLTDRSRE